MKKNKDIEDKLTSIIDALERNASERRKYNCGMLPAWSEYHKDIELIGMLTWILEELEKDND